MKILRLFDAIWRALAISLFIIMLTVGLVYLFDKFGIAVLGILFIGILFSVIVDVVYTQRAGKWED